MTPREFEAASRGFYDREMGRYKADMERMRWMGYITFVSMQGSKKVKKPQDLMRFEWEKGQSKELTPEQLEWLLNKLGRTYGQA